MEPLYLDFTSIPLRKRDFFSKVKKYLGGGEGRGEEFIGKEKFRKIFFKYYLSWLAEEENFFGFR